MFADLDGDGLEEMIAITTSEEDPMGDYWKIWKQGKGGMTQVQPCGNLFYWCHVNSFFKMAFDNGGQKLVGLGMHAGYTEGKFGKIVKPTPDCVFQVGKDSYELSELSPDVDSVFMGNGPRFIERLYPEWYFGFDFKPPKDVPHSPYLMRPPYTKPKGDLRIGGGIGEPPKFAEFVARYRQSKKQKLAAENKTVSVYAVFLDADNDGDADFYITSDLDKLDDGNYTWELHTQQEGEFAPAKDVVYPVASRKELCGLPPTVKASQTSFCRVVRLDVEPVFLIVDGAKKNQVRDAIMGPLAHRVEKLPCRTCAECQRP